MALTPQGIMGLWIAIGMVAGIAVGIASGRLVLGTVAGVGLGIALGAYVSGRRGKRHGLDDAHE